METFIAEGSGYRGSVESWSRAGLPASPERHCRTARGLTARSEPECGRFAHEAGRGAG